jgi:hypothetical protein
MIQHQEISIDADEIIPQRSFPRFLHNLTAILFAYEMDETLLGIRC